MTVTETRPIPYSWITVFNTLTKTLDASSTVLTKRFCSTAEDDEFTRSAEVSTTNEVINALIDHLGATPIESQPPAADELLIMWNVVTGLVSDPAIPITERPNPTFVAWKPANPTRQTPRTFHVTLAFDGGVEVDVYGGDNHYTNDQIKIWRVTAPPSIGQWQAESLTEAVVSAFAAAIIAKNGQYAA